MKVTRICFVVVLLWDITMVTGIGLSFSESKCTHFVMEDKIKEDMPRLLRLKKRNPSIVICVKRCRESLLGELKDIGGYNPDYIATEKSQLKDFGEPSVVFNGTHQPLRRPIPPKKIKRPPIPPYLIYQRLVSMSNAMKRSMIKGLELDKRDDVVPGIQSCIKGGGIASAESDPEILRHMCHSCHYINEQPQNWFPQYLNERVCTHLLMTEPGVSVDIDDKPVNGDMCVAKAGNCIQKAIKIKGLVATGEVVQKNENYNMQQWKAQDMEIRTNCECELTDSKKSLLERFSGIPD